MAAVKPSHKFLCQTLGATLGAREDQSLTFFRIEQLADDIRFLSRPDLVGLELHAFGRLEHGAQSNPNRLAHIVTHQPGN
jgi:hypothetical protein